MIADIIIDQLELSTIIGIHPHERANKQPLHLSLALKYDISKASCSDLIDDALDYDHLSQKISQFVNNSSFFLIEKAAHDIATFILSDQRILEVSLFLYKPNALKSAKRVGIKLLKKQQLTKKDLEKSTYYEMPNQNASLNWD